MEQFSLIPYILDYKIRLSSNMATYLEKLPAKKPFYLFHPMGGVRFYLNR